MDDELSNITITSATVFDGEIVNEKDVCEVTDRTRHQARYLISLGKAVEGEVVEVADLKIKPVDKSLGLSTSSSGSLVIK